ncbi:MAG: hypothetical protein Q9165_001002 [Trypethelium subeluteriae]
MESYTRNNTQRIINTADSWSTEATERSMNDLNLAWVTITARELQIVAIDPNDDPTILSYDILWLNHGCLRQSSSCSFQIEPLCNGSIWAAQSVHSARGGNQYPSSAVDPVMASDAPTRSNTMADKDESAVDTGITEILDDPRLCYVSAFEYDMKDIRLHPWLLDDYCTYKKDWILFSGLSVDLWTVDMNSEKAPVDYSMSEAFKWELVYASANDLAKSHPRTTSWITPQGDWQCPAEAVVHQEYLRRLTNVVEDLIQKHDFTEETFVNPKFASEEYLAREAICMLFIRLSECQFGFPRGDIYQERCFLAHSYGGRSHLDNATFEHHFRSIWKMISEDFLPRKSGYEDFIQKFAREALAAKFKEEWRRLRPELFSEPEPEPKPEPSNGIPDASANSPDERLTNCADWGSIHSVRSDDTAKAGARCRLLNWSKRVTTELRWKVKASFRRTNDYSDIEEDWTMHEPSGEFVCTNCEGTSWRWEQPWPRPDGKNTPRFWLKKLAKACSKAMVKPRKEIVQEQTEWSTSPDHGGTEDSAAGGEVDFGGVCSCIAHGTTILTEHTTSAASQTSSLASLILPKIEHSTPQKLTYTHGPNFIHYIADAASDHPSSHHTSSAGALTYLVVAQSDLGRRVPFGYLVEIRRRFLAEYPPATTRFAELPAYGAAAFNAVLKRLMLEFGSTEAGRQDAFRNVQEEIEDVRGIMSENIERVLERGERIDLLVDKTDRLGGSARDFRVRSRGLRRKMWWKNVRLMVLLVVVVIFLIYLFVGFGCGLPGWSKCVGHSKKES